jgi:DNA invertase Pin-like site-specific DNA recombinase
MAAKEQPTLIPYLRASTVRQGESSLGLDAQRAAVEAFSRQHGGAITATDVEVGSGRRSDRLPLHILTA